MPVVAHLVLTAPRRAQVQLTVTAERGPDGERHVGRLNRQLHWFEFGYYRERGRREYDSGGIVLDPAHHLAGASRFKRSFGGRVVTEHVVRVARPWALRGLLARVFRADDRNPAMNAARGPGAGACDVRP
jgi:hypothetical protein